MDFVACCLFSMKKEANILIKVWFYWSFVMSKNGIFRLKTIIFGVIFRRNR